jgi:hypothetical protein
MVATPSASVAEIVVRIINRASCGGHGRLRAICRLAVAIGGNSLYEGGE